MNLQDGIEVHLFDFLALVEHPLARYHRQTLQGPHGVRTDVGLHIAYADIGAAAQHLACVLKHTEGLVPTPAIMPIYILNRPRCDRRIRSTKRKPF